ncbi:hypothetical protein BG74_06490 [Sodalis-like endosymbiont of Proechinophthirus fluctus]|nr:hypothetical protein BG74_06490 [Sodalis-like endosymbiont of Proechinophthirus fluctus]
MLDTKKKIKPTSGDNNNAKIDFPFVEILSALKKKFPGDPIIARSATIFSLYRAINIMKIL